MAALENARKFIYKNARPLDIARWNYLFENGKSSEVVKYLSSYQNEDGGFGSALEPDCWNPKSTPLQTWVATKIIKEIGLEDKTHPLITGILKYFSAGDEFDGHRWHGLNTVQSNNDYPHAPWWSYLQNEETGYNPTASLIGFILKYADEKSPLYLVAGGLAQEAYQYFKKNFPLESMHEVACFAELYEYMKECNIPDLLDLEEFKTLLQQQIRKVITYDTGSWSTDYVCKPSQFIHSKKSDFYSGNEDICNFECTFVNQTQNADGTWNVTWNWDSFPEQWSISKNWWKSDIIIRNMAYIKAFEKETG